MKVRRIIWPVMLIATGLACCLSWVSIPPQSSQARIKIENDSPDIRGQGFSASSRNSPFDTYYVAENHFNEIVIASRKPGDVKRTSFFETKPARVLIDFSGEGDVEELKSVHANILHPNANSVVTGGPVNQR
jgi:hypothetical protein